MATNIYDATKYPINLLFDSNSLVPRSESNSKVGDKLTTGFSAQQLAVGITYFPVEYGKTYLIKATANPTILGSDGSTTYTYNNFNTIWFHREKFKCTENNIDYYELECHYMRGSSYYAGRVNSTNGYEYTGSRAATDVDYKATDYTDRVLIKNANDETITNSPSSSGALVLSSNTNGVYVTILSENIKYISFNIEPKEFPTTGITTLIPAINKNTVTHNDANTTLFSAVQNGLVIEEVEAVESPSIYVRGDSVDNATSYELFEKVGSAYNSLATANSINFEVSALDFSVGSHTLVVKAKADGYKDSNYSNEVVYTQA